MRAVAVRGGGRTKKIRLPSLGMGPQIVALLLVLGLLGAMAIEPTRQLIEQRERIEGMSSELRGIQKSNRRLENRIGRLKDPDFLEQRARNIGLVRPGETAYVVMPPSQSASRADQARSQEKVAPVPRDEPGFLDGLLAFLGVP
ncbi:MAG TPA: septum formation initiator family protein [Actinomycetota bacterium]|nr:septum formation initiator family protein [Actinomycetota bacterium]